MIISGLKGFAAEHLALALFSSQGSPCSPPQGVGLFLWDALFLPPLSPFTCIFLLNFSLVSTACSHYHWMFAAKWSCASGLWQVICLLLVHFLCIVWCPYFVIVMVFYSFLANQKPGYDNLAWRCSVPSLTQNYVLLDRLARYIQCYFFVFVMGSVCTSWDGSKKLAGR